MTSSEPMTVEQMEACTECGMPCASGEFHPFAACLMFKGCHHSGTVRANLAQFATLAAQVEALRKWAMDEQANGERQAKRARDAEALLREAWEWVPGHDLDTRISLHLADREGGQ